MFQSDSTLKKKNALHKHVNHISAIISYTLSLLSLYGLTKIKYMKYSICVNANIIISNSSWTKLVMNTTIPHRIVLLSMKSVVNILEGHSFLIPLKNSEKYFIFEPSLCSDNLMTS